jgi:predicted nucleotidyltransferase
MIRNILVSAVVVVFLFLGIHPIFAQTGSLPEFEQLPEGLEGVYDSSVAYGDYDEDGDLDILLTGRKSISSFSFEPISRIYRNDEGVFTDIEAGLEGVDQASVSWGDFDGDGDLDILLTGKNSSNQLISRIYENNGDGTFSDIVAGLVGVTYSSVAWGDYDGDGDLDILLTGLNFTYQPISRIYRNDAGTFTDIVAGLEEVGYSSVAWGDYDEDGDLDILLSGRASRVDPITGVNLNYPISRIYRNDGEDGFIDIEDGLVEDDRILEGVAKSSVAWGDYDGDGDLDILLTGDKSTNQPISRIYRNNGADSFEDINAGLEGVDNSSVAWGDYDGDGDLDILLTGNNSLPEATTLPISKIYRNDSGTFTDINQLKDVWNSSVAWGDYDNDGDLDILLTGRTRGADSRIYRNDAGTFVDINAGLEGVDSPSVAWGDYDGDGDLDILLWTCYI